MENLIVYGVYAKCGIAQRVCNSLNRKGIKAICLGKTVFVENIKS